MSSCLCPLGGGREKRLSFSSAIVSCLCLLPTMSKGTKLTAEVVVSEFTATGAVSQSGPVPLETLWPSPRGGRRAALAPSSLTHLHGFLEIDWNTEPASILSAYISKFSTCTNKCTYQALNTELILERSNHW